MSQPKKKGLVPVLRFPEFRNLREWEVKIFGEICKFVRGPFGGALKKEIFVEDGYAVYEQSHAIHQNFDYFRYYITEEKYSELKRFSVLPNDIIVSCSGTMGKFAIIPPESKKGIINQALLKLTVKKDYDLKFIKSTLDLPDNQEKLLSQSAGGAIKNIVSVDQIKEIVLYIPDIKEQQKIADCLTSIDELVSAQTQKVEALKAHKKGLMQQLFPAEGETVPKLRFPEFRDAGEWEEINLGSIGKVSMCKRILKNETKPYGDIPFYKIGTFGKQADAYISREIYESYKSKYSYPKKGDILISASGTIGRLVVFDGEAAYFQDSNIVWIDNNESLVENAFLFYCYKSIKWATNNNTIARLYNDNLSGMEIFITPFQNNKKSPIAYPPSTN